MWTNRSLWLLFTGGFPAQRASSKYAVAWTTVVVTVMFIRIMWWMNWLDRIISFQSKIPGKIFQILRGIRKKDNCYNCHRTPVITMVPYVPNGSFVRTETVKWTASHATVYRKYLKYSVMLVQVAERISHDDVIKWKHLPRYWPFVREIHRSPVNSPHTRASDAERGCFLWSVPESTVE